MPDSPTPTPTPGSAPGSASDPGSITNPGSAPAPGSAPGNSPGSDNDHQEPARSSGGPSGKKRLGVLKLLLAVVLLAAVLVALLPTLLSTPLARGLIVGKVNEAIPGSVQVRSLRIGWRKPVSMDGFVLHDARGATLLEIDQLQTQGGSLLNLIRTGGRRLQAEVTGVRAAIVVDEGGRMNLLDAVVEPPADASAEPPAPTPGETKPRKPQPEETDQRPSTPTAQPAEPIRLPRDLALMLQVKQVDVTVSTPQTVAPVRSTFTQLLLDARNLQAIKIKADGLLYSGTDGPTAGGVLVDGTVTSLVDDQGVIDPAGMDVEFDLLVESFPLALLAAGGVDPEPVIALAGADALTLSSKIDGHAGDLVATASFNAGDTLGASLVAGFDGRVLTLQQPAVLDWSVSPQALARVSQLNATEPVRLNARLRALSLPLSGSVPDLDAISFDGGLQLAAAAFEIPELGTVRLDGLSLGLGSSALGQKATLTVNGAPAVNGQAGALSLTVDAIRPLAENARRIEVTGGLRDTPLAPILDGALGMDGLIAAALGPSQTLDIKAATNARPDLPALTADWTIQGGGAGWTIAAQGTLADEQLDLSPLTLTLQITPPLVTAMSEQGWLGETPLALAEPATVELNLQGRVPIRGDLAAASLSGRVDVDPVSIRGIEALEAARLRDLTLTISEGRLDQNKTVRLDAALPQGAKRGSINLIADGVFVTPSKMPRLNRSRLAVAQVPVGLLERIAGLPGQLKPWLGASVDQLELVYQPQDPAASLGDATASLKLATPMVTGGGVVGIRQNEESIWLSGDPQNPLSFTAQVRDQSFKALRSAAEQDSPLRRLSLQGTAVATVTLPVVAWRQPLAAASDQAAEITPPPTFNVQAQAQVAGLTLVEENGAVTAIERVSMNASTQDSGQTVALQVSALRPGGTRPMLLVQGELSGLGPSPNPSPDEPGPGIGFAGKVDGHRLPMSLADALAGTKSLLPRLLGEAVDVDWQGAWPGAANVKLTSNAIELITQTQTDASQETVLLPGGLSLTFDLVNLGDNALLGQLHPLFDMLRQSTLVQLDPIALTLNQGTTLPIKNASLEALNLAGGLNFGRVKMETGDDLVKLLVDYATKHQDTISTRELQDTLELVNQGLKLAGEDPIKFGGRLSDPGKGKKSKNSTATVTTIPFTLNNGVIETGQTWVDSRDVQVGFQGKTDLKTGTVDYKLGVPGKTLIGLSQDVFGKVLAPDQIYEFSLAGNRSAGGDGLTLAGDGFDAFFRSGLMRQLQSRLGAGGGLDLTQWGVKQEDSELIGGLLGGLLGGGAPPTGRDPSPATAQAGGPNRPAARPQHTVPWKLPDPVRP